MYMYSNCIYMSTQKCFVALRSKKLARLSRTSVFLLTRAQCKYMKH